MRLHGAIIGFDFGLISEACKWLVVALEKEGTSSGSANKSSPEQSQRLSELAKTHAEKALQTLVDLVRNGRTDAARVSAANALLDRAHGKPAVKEEKEIVDLLPVVIQLVRRTDEARDLYPLQSAKGYNVFS